MRPIFWLLILDACLLTVGEIEVNEQMSPHPQPGSRTRRTSAGQRETTADESAKASRSANTLTFIPHQVEALVARSVQSEAKPANTEQTNTTIKGTAPTSTWIIQSNETTSAIISMPGATKNKSTTAEETNVITTKFTTIAATTRKATTTPTTITTTTLTTNQKEATSSPTTSGITEPNLSSTDSPGPLTSSSHPITSTIQLLLSTTEETVKNATDSVSTESTTTTVIIWSSVSIPTVAQMNLTSRRPSTAPPLTSTTETPTVDNLNDTTSQSTSTKTTTAVLSSTVATTSFTSTQQTISILTTTEQETKIESKATATKTTEEVLPHNVTASVAMSARKTKEESESSSAGVIIGVVVGMLLLVAVVALAWYCINIRGVGPLLFEKPFVGSMPLSGIQTIARRPLGEAFSEDRTQPTNSSSASGSSELSPNDIQHLGVLHYHKNVSVQMMHEEPVGAMQVRPMVTFQVAKDGHRSITIGTEEEKANK